MKFNKVNTLTLAHEIKVIIPSTKNVNQSVSNAEMVNKVAQELSILNGGATIFDARGAWNSDELGLICEGVSVVVSSCNEITAEVLEKVYQIGLNILVGMSQEAVSVYLDGELNLIFPE